jgi:hypothetical protein
VIIGSAYIAYIGERTPFFGRCLGGVRHILALLSLKTYNIATMIHAVAMIIANTAMTAIILLRSKK